MLSTLNGGVTSTRGAAVSVEPVTAMLPVAPVSVHSAGAPFSGARVGQVLFGRAGVVAIWVTDAALGFGVSVLVEHAERASSETAAAATDTGAIRRGEFTS